MPARSSVSMPLAPANALAMYGVTLTSPGVGGVGATAGCTSVPADPRRTCRFPGSWRANSGHCGTQVGLAGEEHHGNSEIVFARDAQKLHAAHPRHLTMTSAATFSRSAATSRGRVERTLLQSREPRSSSQRRWLPGVCAPSSSRRTARRPSPCHRESARVSSAIRRSS
jgi:hypothetical protein